MSDNEVVAVIGAGTIGLSWAVLAASAGHHVRVSDPRPDVDQAIDEAVRSMGSEVAGVDPAQLRQRIESTSSLAEAIAGCDVVHENGPERLEVKQELFEQIAGAAPTGALLTTSTSGLDPERIGARLLDPSRVVVAHPFNPPHLIPLVEVVPMAGADEQVVDDLFAYLRGLGRHPVLIHRVVDGFVANRLQRALFNEAVSLVEDGVVSVAELDEVVMQSLGIRWATAGPFLSFHLGGGPGGLHHMMEHLMVGRFSEQLGEKLVEQTDEAYGTYTYEQLAAERGRAVPAVISAVRAAQNSTA